MGFQRKRKIYKLDFTGTEFEGLEVQVSSLTTGEYLDFVLLTGSSDGGTGKETTEMLSMLSKHLVSWNLEDESGAPVSLDFEGLKTNELKLNTLILDAWISAISDVPEATEKKSLPGETSLVASIPTETL